MAKIFNQHAYADDLHLETSYIKPHRWEWVVLLKGRQRIAYGASETLEGAKQAIIKAAGLDASKVDWEKIGPAVENLPD